MTLYKVNGMRLTIIGFDSKILMTKTANKKGNKKIVKMGYT